MWLNDGKSEKLINAGNFKSVARVIPPAEGKSFRRSIIYVGSFFLIILFLPWTQNVRAPGKLTTLRPEERPQELNAIIAGRIDKWYVKEGDMVKKGDTILKLTEVKPDYLDPELLKRTEEQVFAKEKTVDNYMDKVTAIQNQLAALYQARELKLDQIRNKIKQARAYVISDSINLEAAKVEFDIAEKQFERLKQMTDQGLASLTDLERRKQTLQNASAKVISLENKLFAARQELTNSIIELQGTDREYSEKLAKAESDKFSTLSMVTTGEGDLAKLKNQFKNYSMRNAFYYILAPQEGQVTRTVKAGLGEIVKESELLCQITPLMYDVAVEMYVEPFDLPLLFKDQKVRFMFDGWPAIVFSGWPNVSYGTFGGKVMAIDNNISPNGKFRVLVGEDPAETPWPQQLKVGGGAKGFAMLKDVPVWYELWRNLNGFPPDFYQTLTEAKPSQASGKKVKEEKSDEEK